MVRLCGLNGFNISDKDTCDTSNDYSGGHALLVFDDFSVEFYKTYEPIIKFEDQTKRSITIKCFDKPGWYNKKLDLYVQGLKLDNRESVNWFEVRYRKKHYLVICGNYVGRGFEKNHLSKYLLKNVTYNGKDYIIKTKFETMVYDIVEHLQRKDDIDFERSITWEFGAKPFLKELLKFKFDKYYFDHMIEGLYKIHLLK